MKVRHDSEAIQEGEARYVAKFSLIFLCCIVRQCLNCQSVIMTLSDQRLIDKDGNLVET